MPSVNRPLLGRGELLSRRVARPQGGGPPFYPLSIRESEDHLRPLVETARAAVSETPAALLGDQVYFELTMRPNFVANSHFPEQLLSWMGASVVGTRFDTADYVTRQSAQPDVVTKTLIVAGDGQSIEGLSDLIEEAESERTLRPKRDLRVLDDVRLAAVTDIPVDDGDVEEGDVLQWDLVLHPQAAPGPRRLSPASTRTVRKLRKLADSIGVRIESDHLARVGGLTFVSARATVEQIAQLSAFNPLRAVYPVVSTPEPDLDSLDDQLELPAVAAPEPNALRVAIFDGGLADATSPVYHDRVTLVDHTGVGVNLHAERHGMLVTSAALYGHAPVDLGSPNGVVIDHHRIWPYANAAGDPDMVWAIEKIEDVAADGEYDVVIVACAPVVFLDESIIDRWTATLDQLAAETSTLFVIAAGNHEPHQTSNRVQVPGSAVNALTVGSAANHAPARVAAASHSRVGPGRAGARMAPSGLWFGGTPDDPFVGIDDAGSALSWYGTSFAAPAFAGSLGSLHRLLGSRSRPDLWRAFAVHFADPGKKAEQAEVGYGRLPEDYSAFFNCEEHEVHVLYETPIERGETVAFDLPIPDGILGKLDLKWTVVFTSPVEPSNAVEYTQVGLDVQLRPHALRFHITDGSTRRPVHLDNDAALIARLVKQGWRLSPEPDTVAVPQLGASTAAMRLEGKWETIQVRKRGFQPGSLNRPRVDITHYSRHGGVLTGATDPIDVVMLLSVRAKQGVDVYDSVRAKYQQLVEVTSRATQTVSTRASS